MASIRKRSWVTVGGKGRSAWVVDYFDEAHRRHIKTFSSRAAATQWLHAGARPLAWLIWSEEHGAWWKPAQWGYTTSIIGAGLYTEARAREITAQANRYSANIHEVAMPDPLGRRFGPKLE